jgi:NitT/TauT family transport system substrate-binding protein
MERKKRITRRSFIKGAGLLGTSTALGLGFPNVILGGKKNKTTVRLGYYNCDHMTAAPIAKEAGIFDKLGLNVEMTGNGKVPQAMAAGRMDVGYIGFTGMLKGIMKGSPIVSVANNHAGGSMYIVTQPEIEKPEQLIGKKLGIGTAPERNHEMWVWFAKDAGIPVEGKHYQCFAMADRDEYLALKTKQLDGYFCCDPWGSMAEYEKTGRILHRFGALPSGTWGYCCTLVMNKKFVKQHRGLAKKMVSAHIDAIRHIYTKPLKSAEIFSKYYHVPHDVALMTIYKKTVGETRTLRWNISPEVYNEEIDHHLKLGVLKSAPLFNDAMTNELLTEVQAMDFKAFIKNEVDRVFPLGMTFADWKNKVMELKA